MAMSWRSGCIVGVAEGHSDGKAVHGSSRHDHHQFPVLSKIIGSLGVAAEEGDTQPCAEGGGQGGCGG